MFLLIFFYYCFLFSLEKSQKSYKLKINELENELFQQNSENASPNNNKFVDKVCK